MIIANEPIRRGREQQNQDHKEDGLQSRTAGAPCGRDVHNADWMLLTEALAVDMLLMRDGRRYTKVSHKDRSELQ